MQIGPGIKRMPQAVLRVSYVSFLSFSSPLRPSSSSLDFALSLVMCYLPTATHINVAMALSISCRRGLAKQVCAATHVVNMAAIYLALQGKIVARDELDWSPTFEAHLGSMNGVPSKFYKFQIVSLPDNNTETSFPDGMLKACKQFGMKPVCDHRNYCGHGPESIYIGQAGHLAYLPHRETLSAFPRGFSGIRHKWDGLCTYVPSAYWKDPRTRHYMLNHT